MRPPIFMYSLFVEEFLLWLLNPPGVNTLIQFLCLRTAREFGWQQMDWITYMAPGTALFFFLCSTVQFTSFVRYRVFVAAPPRLVMVMMRMSILLWAALAVMVLFAVHIAYHHIANGVDGDLSELYRDKVFILTLLSAATAFQIFKPTEE